jgi:acetyl-CoA decarbonylase/synthase complex subunit gamma
VLKRTGFQVVYGPVYAKDLPAFLKAGMKAEPQMRRIGFSLRERLAVAPVEIVQRILPACVIFVILVLLSGVHSGGYRFTLDQWPWMAFIIGGNFIMGLILFPAFLPWLPGRSFSIKGAFAGIILGALLGIVLPFGLCERISVGILSAAACSFLGLMFTGSTPYTSASGVRSEMRWALPSQAVLGIVGLLGWLAFRVA